MAKQMTDEQKLFFGTKSQRAAMKKKHPSWARDKSGFRQTIKGKRNPFKKAAGVAKKVAKKVKKITLATINAKIRKGLKLNAADSAWVRKHQPTDAYLGYTTPLKPSAPDYTKRVTKGYNGGGGSTNWLTGDQLVAQKDRELLEGASKVIDQVIGKAVPGGVGDLFKNVIGNAGLFQPGLPSSMKGGVAAAIPGVLAAGLIPGDVFSPPVERVDYEAIKESNLAWMEANPAADVYGIYDPQYFIG